MSLILVRVAIVAALWLLVAGTPVVMQHDVVASDLHHAVLQAQGCTQDGPAAPRQPRAMRGGAAAPDGMHTPYILALQLRRPSDVPNIDGVFDCQERLGGVLAYCYRKTV